MQLTGKQKKQKILLEIRDLLMGAAFPLMIQIIFSASIILFADMSEEPAMQIVALVVGEILLLAAYVLFGRQNGIVAYRRFRQNSVKRELGTEEVAAYFGTGEYALWKGFVIALISTVPFILIQFIECVAPNSVCDFLLKYAFGWAAYPFIVIAGSGAKFSEWLNFIWIIIPVGVHAASYVWGRSIERARQDKVAAQQSKGKRK